MARFELVIFDWDGTLMDSTAQIAHAVQRAALDLGLVPPNEERARHIIGLGLRDALHHAVPELPVTRYEEMAARYRHHYLLAGGQGLFPGVAHMVRSLRDRGRLLAVATGKSRSGLDRAMTDSGMDGCFHATRCADDCYSKPHPQMLLELLDEFGMGASRAVMIGDTTHDLLMARNAGMAAVAVAYGAHPRQDLLDLSPLHCADTTEDLRRWLEENT